MTTNTRKRLTLPPPDFTRGAKLAIFSANVATKALRTELLHVNSALTVEGHGTTAEMLAHDALLRIMELHSDLDIAMGRLADAAKGVR